MLIILRSSVLPHKHPHELLDSVVKERSADSFVSAKAAHSTAAFTSVKPVSKIFSFLLNRLRHHKQICSPVAGGEFYRLKQGCQQRMPAFFESPGKDSLSHLRPTDRPQWRAASAALQLGRRIAISNDATAAYASHSRQSARTTQSICSNASTNMK